MLDSHVHEIEKLVSRVNFYESCIEQLNKEAPKYFVKQQELGKAHNCLSKLLRNVASSEPNRQLQDVLLLYSEKQDMFEKEREIYLSCETITQKIIENSKAFLIAPLKEIINDHRVVQKDIVAFKTGNDKKKKIVKSDATDVDYVASTLPIHVKMFEKHRVNSLKILLSTMLKSELKYHCKVVEELTLVMQELSVINEDDEKEA